MSGCGGGCDRLVMVVGGGGCWRRGVCVLGVGRGRRLLCVRCFVVVVAVCGRLCSWASLFVVVVGGRRRSQRGRSSSVVVCLDGGGKQRSNHVTLPNKHCLLSVTNK